MNALNLVINVGEQIVEVIIEKEELTIDEAWGRVRELFDLVELEPDRVTDYPHEFSGGMRQRVAIARALMLEPTFIIADEPVSMLDASIRTKILNLLKELRENYDLTFLYITHDIAQARYVGDHLMIMYLGRIVERGPMEDVILEPLHPYTRTLISNVPILDPEAQRENPLNWRDSDAHRPAGGLQVPPEVLGGRRTMLAGRARPGEGGRRSMGRLPYMRGDSHVGRSRLHALE